MVDTSDLTLPIINVSGFSNNESTQDVDLARALVQAFETRGFAYISGHGISETKTAAAFAQSRAVMELQPERKKQMLCGSDGVDTRGYVYPGMAKVTQNENATGEVLARINSLAPGTNETFRYSDRGYTPPERIPISDFPDLPEVYSVWFDEVEALYHRLLRMLGLGLGIGSEYFQQYHLPGKTSRNLSVQHYLGGKASESGARLNEHTDYGFMTILFQDDVGGLEVVDVSKGEAFVPAPPVDGCVTVNVGDMLSRWTNGILKSTMHRVQAPPKSIKGGVLPERFSMPVFLGPGDNTVIEPIPGTYGPDRPKQFGAVDATRHIQSRQAKMYAKRQELGESHLFAVKNGVKA